MSTDEARAEDPRGGERYERVFAATYRRVLAYVVRRVSDPADAADVVAETYLVAWRRIAELPDGDEAVPWLFAVARRCLANHRRGEFRRFALTERLASSLTTAMQVVESPCEQSPVEVALAQLGPDDQELLRLVEWDALDRAEIAATLGISRNAVRIRLYRARRRLADALSVQQREPRLEYTREGS